MGGTTQEGTRKTVQKTTQEDVGTVSDYGSKPTAKS